MSKKNPDNLEFNDGLGDLLREKESRQFSFQRTVIVLGVFVLVVFFVLFVTVKLGTRFLFAPDPASTAQTEKIDHDALLRELAEMEHLMAEKKNAAVTTESVTTESVVTASVPAVPVVAPVTKKEAVAKPAPAPAKTIVPTKRIVVKKPTAALLPYKVIVGTFAELKNATEFQKELKKQGIESFVWDRQVDGRDWHAVQAGAFATKESAQRFVAALIKKGYPAYVLHK
jgi:cell division septation protein DedD